MKLQELGWDTHFREAFEAYKPEGSLPARVAVSYGSSCTCWTTDGELKATVGGRLRLGHDEGDTSPTGLPTVGDWVALRPPAAPGAAALVHAILPRKTAFIRKVAGTRFREQVVAANIDYVLVITSLNREFNVRRLERYVTLTRESGAEPVIVLSKTDLAPNLVAEHREKAMSVAPGVPVHAVSAHTGEGLDELLSYSEGYRTLALLGSSGVGKSTIINRLAGREVLPTQEVREDDRGRHTTTHRELVILPGGGILVDTPGMRELQMWESAEGLTKAFDDIEQLASQCRFGNCRHQTEPGCAVLHALESGILSAARFESYRGLHDEISAAGQLKTEQARRENKRPGRVGAREAKSSKRR